MYLYTLARVGSYVHYKMWDDLPIHENTYPFPNFNDYTIEVLEWMNIFIPCFTGRIIT